MKSTYGLIRERCGLSIVEAAAFHKVPDDTVKAWSSGRRRAPAGVIEELRELYDLIDNAAHELEQLVGDESGEIELGLASDDTEAQSIGWPCVGAHAAALGLAACYLNNDVVIVPRGSTAATAAAADIHDKERS